MKRDGLRIVVPLGLIGLAATGCEPSGASPAGCSSADATCQPGEVHSGLTCRSDCTWSEPMVFEPEQLRAGQVQQSILLADGESCRDADTWQRYLGDSSDAPLRVRIVMCTDDAGEAVLDLADVEADLAVANASFAGSGLRFVVDGAMQLESDPEACDIDLEVDASPPITRGTFPDALGLVYLHTLRSGTGGVAGYGTPYPGVGVILGVARSGRGHTVAHELGHVLGLDHPHACANGRETTDTCETTGDELCSTPADPGPAWSSNLGTCDDGEVKAGTCTAALDCSAVSCEGGETPDITNLMSYYSCGESLTDEQLAVSRCVAEDRYAAKLDRVTPTPSARGTPSPTPLPTRPPALLGIEPNSGVVGQRVIVRISGVDLVDPIEVTAAPLQVEAVRRLGANAAEATLVLTQARQGRYRIVVRSGQSERNFAFDVVQPWLHTLSPISARPGGEVELTLFGRDFPADAVVDAGAFIPVTGSERVSERRIRATLDLSDAPAGLHSLRVAWSGGQTRGRSFNVLAPQLFSVAPAEAGPGQRVKIALRGKGFAQSVALDAGRDITVSDLTRTTSDTIEATLDIAADAKLGARGLRLETAGRKLFRAFRVLAPRLLAVAPSQIHAGLISTLRVTGRGFPLDAGAIEVSVEGGGVNVLEVTPLSTQSFSFAVAVESAAVMGGRTLRVSLRGAEVGALRLELLGAAPPVLASVRPARLRLGEAVALTLRGQRLAAEGLSVELGADVVVSGIEVVSASELTVTVTPDSDAAAGPRALHLGGAGGDSNALEVELVAPTLLSVSPHSVRRGRRASLRLLARDFTPDAAALELRTGGPGLSVVQMATGGANFVDAIVDIAADAPLGELALQLVSSGAATNSVELEVTEALAPRVRRVSPRRVVQGEIVTLEIEASGMAGGEQELHFDDGLSVLDLERVTIDRIRATVEVSPTADAGRHVLWLDGPSGQSAFFSFTVVAPRVGAPRPGVVTQGTTQTLRITGQFLAEVTTDLEVSSVAPGVEILEVFELDTRGFSLRLRVDAAAALGPQTLRVLSRGAIAGQPGLFVTAPRRPTLLSVTPSLVDAGSVTEARLRGRNFSLAGLELLGGDDFSVALLEWVSAEELRVELHVAPSAAPGLRSLQLRTRGGVSNSLSFRVR